MDELIKSYLDDNFHPETVKEFSRAFKNFESFQLEDYELPYANLLAQAEDLDPLNVRDAVISLVRGQCTEILKAHLIRVSEEITLPQFNEFMDALLLVQDLADYSTILAILDSPIDEEEKLCDIIAELSMLSSAQAMTLVESFDPSTLQALRNYILSTPEEKNKENAKVDESIRKIITHYRKFSDWCGEVKPIGNTLLAAEVKPNLPFTSYLTYLTPLQEEKDITLLAKHVMSLLLLSSDGWQTPLLTFRKHSGEALSDLKLTMRVDGALTGILGEFAHYLDVLKSHPQGA